LIERRVARCQEGVGAEQQYKVTMAIMLQVDLGTLSHYSGRIYLPTNMSKGWEGKFVCK